MDAEIAPDATPMPQSGWKLRLGRGSGDRLALEVHTGDGLIDVAVAGGPGAVLVRGAVRGRRFSAAWGQLPPGGEVLVEFRAGSASHRVEAVTVAGAFWAAEVPGRYREVVVTTAVDRSAYRLHRFRERRTGRGVRVA
jgi:hypothetical protein